MFHAVLLLTAAALLCGSCRSSNVNRHMKLLEVDNTVNVNVQSRQVPKRMLSLLKKPKPVTVHLGNGPLELTCEAVGAPAPSVHWFKNDAPVYEYDLESNEVIDTNPTSLARVASTLLVPRAKGKDEYTCLVVAGSNTTRATTVVYSTNGVNELTERSKLIPLAPRILVTYKVFADSIGSNVVLPCRVKGHPRPKVVWRDNGGRLIDRDPRMKVLRSGELVIFSLRWSDLGDFICHASNMFGSQTAKTFVYPARAE